MFVTVKYGDNLEKLVNPNCLSAVLLSHLRKTCGFDSIPEHLDLASESGEVMDLANKSKEYAKKFLEPHTTYILVKVVGDETEENGPVYIPLLENQSLDKIKFSVTNPTFRRAKKGQPALGKSLADEPLAKSKLPLGGKENAGGKDATQPSLPGSDGKKAAKEEPISREAKAKKSAPAAQKKK